MPANPSYYFTLFKKFQVLNHVASNSVHGSANPTAGFDLRNAAAAFGNSNRGALLGASANPADSPLWAILNAKATGGAPPVIGGTQWPIMPLGTPVSWTDFQVNAPAPKLVQVFADWIQAGKVNDVPNGVLGTMPPPIAGALDPGVVLFACSMPGDDGVRPGNVPPDYWATSLIFLVDPATGNSVFPGQLSAASDYYLAAVIGNRGNAHGGRYMSPAAVGLEAAGWVMVWNAGTSPSVQLPALSNLDVNSTNGVYGVYFLRSGRYDVVGFRLNVQTVFDGLVAAVAASGMDLGGLTAAEWVHAEGAHLCAKVLVRTENESWPALGDTPLTNRRLAQKNLAPFAADVSVVAPDPNIIWKNFVMGDVIQFLRHASRFDDRLGMHRLTIRAELPEGADQLFLAIPKRTFGRWFRKNSFKGFKAVNVQAIKGVKPPFPEHVVLAVPPKEAAFEIPALGEEFLAMSLGVGYSPRRVKPGPLGRITVTQETQAPKIDRRKRRYDAELVTVGGFTLLLEAVDSRQGHDAP